MNVHHRCEKSGCIPKLCGADHTEKRGRIQVKIIFEPKAQEEGRLTVASRSFFLCLQIIPLNNYTVIFRVGLCRKRSESQGYLPSGQNRGFRSFVNDAFIFNFPIF